ncbi:MAG: hypothetical protein WBG30_01595 [Psychrilyobacter sp.]|uniref:hypothetical protein n=1 Tax=Psychrilyobacter sp. TaxID=2586924 RepID=UPI003C70F16E
MKNIEKSKGPWLYRFLIKSFIIIFGILVFWILGFFLEDIESIKGPKYDKIEKSYIESGLITKEKELKNQIEVLTRKQVKNENEIAIVKNSSRNLQNTINQLMALKKLALENSKIISNSEEQQLSKSVETFLKSQKTYQKLNMELAQIIENKQILEINKQELGIKLEDQMNEAQKQYSKLLKSHNLKLAFLQIAVLFPFLLGGIYLILKKKSSNYYLLFIGYGVAVFFKIFLVIHRYFPSRYFKYILILGLLFTVVKILTYLINIIINPKKQWLLKQYRDGYEKFLCPVCEYPIRRGPRKFLYWTRRTVGKVTLQHSNTVGKDKPYSCPSCGTTLFEECPTCHEIKHSLLPTCCHCGSKK